MRKSEDVSSNRRVNGTVNVGTENDTIALIGEGSNRDRVRSETSIEHTTGSDNTDNIGDVT